MKDNKNFFQKYGRLLLLIAVIVLAVILVWAAFGDTVPTYFRLLKEGDEGAIENYVARESAWKGVATIFLLSLLQVVSIVLPGFAIQIASGTIYGWWRALLMCYSGFIIGNILVFSVVRRMGSEIRGFAPSKKEQTSWIKNRMKTTEPGFAVALLNLIPLIPNGIIPYVAAGSSISLSGYTKAIMVTAWEQILLNCLAGQFLKNGQYGFMIGVIGFQILLVIIVAWKRDAIMAKFPGGADTDEDQKE